MENRQGIYSHDQLRSKGASDIQDTHGRLQATILQFEETISTNL